MCTIIAGGSGLIGRALTEDLTADGHEVIVLSRRPERVRGLPPGARAIRWDAPHARGLAEYVEESDAIVNLTGTRIAPWPWTAARKRQILDSRVHSGAAVTQAVESAGKRPRVVVQASGVGFYGPRGDDSIDETAAQAMISWRKSASPGKPPPIHWTRSVCGG